MGSQLVTMKVLPSYMFSTFNHSSRGQRANLSQYIWETFSHLVADSCDTAPPLTKCVAAVISHHPGLFISYLLQNSQVLHTSCQLWCPTGSNLCLILSSSTCSQLFVSTVRQGYLSICMPIAKKVIHIVSSVVLWLKNCLEGTKGRMRHNYPQLSPAPTLTHKILLLLYLCHKSWCEVGSTINLWEQHQKPSKTSFLSHLNLRYRGASPQGWITVTHPSLAAASRDFNILSATPLNREWKHYHTTSFVYQTAGSPSRVFTCPTCQILMLIHRVSGPWHLILILLM